MALEKAAGKGAHINNANRPVFAKKNFHQDL